MAQIKYSDPTELRPLTPEQVAMGYDPMQVEGKPVVVWSVVIVVSLLAIFFAVEAYVMHYREREYDRKVQQPLAEDAATLRSREEGLLSRYQWLDKPTGKVGIPNDRAMELVLQGYQSGKRTYLGNPVNKAQIDASNAGQAAAAADGGAPAAATGSTTNGGAATANAATQGK
jgi:hypothetical protein